MSKTANFKVDPKLAVLLGENYRSTELAIKELIDNAFDADAEQVNIVFPEPYTNNPIVVEDNGTGMTEAEVRNEYLKVANSRFSRKGERTKGKNRLVKGRKGIGKFSGLMVAQEMKIATTSRGITTILTITRDALSKANYDLENISLPISVEETKKTTGTTITLNGINDNLNFPNPERLRQILILEYGREEDFKLNVNEQALSMESIPGERFEYELDLPHAGKIALKFTISDKKVFKQPGILLRVNGKMVGRPQFYGLEDSETIPSKLQQRLVGEIIANEIDEQDITADWGAIIENSKSLADIQTAVQPLLEEAFENAYHAETKIAKAKLKKRISAGLDKLPEFKKAFAKKTLDKVMRKFYGENDARIATVVGVMLDTFEKDDYWVVAENIEKSTGKDSDVATQALSDFGSLDKALIVQRANQRLKLVDRFEQVLKDKQVSTAQICQTVANNLWLLGKDYNMIATNPTLSTIMEEYLERKFKDATKRPSLILSANYNGEYILIDFKPTNLKVTGKTVQETLAYRNDLKIYFPNNDIKVLILGKKEDKISTSEAHFIAYSDLIAESRKLVRWRLNQ